MRRAVLVVVLWALAGCAGRDPDPGIRVGDLIKTLPELSLSQEPAVAPAPEEVLAAYENIYGLIPDGRVNHAIGKRLADLKMGEAEEKALAGSADPYGDAVSLYEGLLASSEPEGRDQILYQLARAHDLVGDDQAAVRYLDRLIAEHPESVYVVEAHFRRAEMSFSAGRYEAAEADYGVVVGHGAETPYWQNATYMRGWAQFKLGDLDAGLSSFFMVVDSVLAERTFESLPQTERELLGDSLRVVTLALGYLDGPDTLASHMRSLARPGWQYLVYEALADDYLANERYLDSVATWQTFIEENTLDPRAPNAHIGMIETLVAADFPSEVEPKKKEFVARYGVRSEFWSLHDEGVRAGYADTLHVYLKELANLSHGRAQESHSVRDWLEAAAFYDEIVTTFPEDPATAHYLFLLGEVYTEAGDHARAVAAYQRVVHEHVEFQRANEAGYAAILGLEQLAATAPAAEAELWARLTIDAQIEFALLFSADERAPSVQGAAADSLYGLGEYEQAVGLADDLLNTWTDLPLSLRKPALLILGHGQFELEDYVAAEAAYQELLRLEVDPAEREPVEERLLAAIYRQGEAAELAGETDVAVAHYLRLSDVAPAAALAGQGHYDAVAVLETEGRLDEAADLLADFRLRHPDHELARDVERRLAGLYEQTGDWAGAAGEYALLAESSADAEVRRQSRYRAAELYLEVDDRPQAQLHFERYVEEFSLPLDANLEAVHQLDVLAAERGDAQDRRRWLQAKVDLHRRFGRDKPERATYLAAEAQYLLAADERLSFDVIELLAPLPKSLKRKQQALKRTVKAFEAVADYGVMAFSTAATFQIADLYSALSRSILVSERPSGLSDLELEQYEILLEEQAFPFEEQAIALHEINMRRSWEGVYDEWVQRSFAELSRLMPARFDKQEVDFAYVETIH